MTQIINKHAAEDALFAADDGTAAVWMLRQPLAANPLKKELRAAFSSW